MGGMSSRGGMSRLDSNRTQSILKADKSELSMSSKITFGGGANEDHAGLVQEKVSEQDESDSHRGDDKTANLGGYGS